MARKHLSRRADAQRVAASRTAERREAHESMLERHDAHCGPLRIDGRTVARVAHYRETVRPKIYPFTV